MFEFLNDINAPILIYDEELSDYVFISNYLLKTINSFNLLEFKEKYCHKRSVFSALLTMQKNNTYIENRQHYFFAPNHLGTTVYFKINLTAPCYNGRKLSVFTLEDCTETQALRTHLENYKITQAMVYSMINSIYTEKDIALLPPHLIASLGIALNVSSILIYEIGPHATNENSYLWHNENIKIKDFIKNVTTQDRQVLYEIFLKQRSFIVERPEQLDAENETRLKLANIKSLAAYPIYINDKPNSVIILQDMIGYRTWQLESETMEIVTTILSNVLSKKQKLVQIKQRETQFKSILDSLPFYIHVSDYETHEIIFANQFYKDTLHKDIVGMKCWQLTNENRTTPCPFCKMNQTVDDAGKPQSQLTVKYFDPNTKKEYQIYENAIQWFDNRYVHFTCAIPIAYSSTHENLHE